MSSEHVQTIDLTGFTGRVFFLADPYGHYSVLCNLIHSVTGPNEDVIIFATGNLFDYGPEPMELMLAINSGLFGGRNVRFYSAAGAGEDMLLKLLPSNPDRRKFYPSTFENERWCSLGGAWHKTVNRFHLEDQINKLALTQLPVLLRLELKGDIRIGLCSSDYAAIRKTFQDTYNALFSFNALNIASYHSQFLYGLDHAVTPVYVDGVNFMILGRNPVNSIRKSHGLPLTNSPVLIGNSLHINTGSLYLSATGPIYAPGIEQVSSPCMTLVELDISSEPTLISHQYEQKANGHYRLKSNVIDLVSRANHVEVTL